MFEQKQQPTRFPHVHGLKEFVIKLITTGHIIPFHPYTTIVKLLHVLLMLLRKGPFACLKTGKHTEGNTSLFFAINIQLPMTGQDNQCVFRGYQRGCHIWIYFIRV